MHFLSNAIARVCAELEGLQIVQLPSGLDEARSVEIVRAANEEAGATPPFAILVGATDDLLSDPMVPKVSRRNAIKYRRGDRLAVVSGSSVDLASFDNSYRRVVGPGFPGLATDVLTVGTMAPHIVELLVDRLGIALDKVVRDQCAVDLVQTLEVLGSCYERATDTTRGWNGLWFDHVEEGLRALEISLRAEADSDRSEPFGEAFRRLVWPSMGLPHEGGNKVWTSDRSRREFTDALAEFWSDYESIQLTLAQLREVVPSTDWGQLDWSDFESARIRRDSLLGALQDVVSRPGAIDRWAEMTLPRFISPLSKGERLELRDVDGRPLNVQSGDSPALLRAEPAGEGWQSDTFDVRVRSSGSLDDSELEAVEVCASSRGVTFVEESKWSLDDAVVVRGHLVLAKRSRLVPVNLKLSLALTPGSQASGRVAAKAEASAVVALTDLGALAWPTNGRLGRAVYCGPENVEDATAGGDFSAELAKESEHLVVVWGGPATSSSATTSELGHAGLLSARVAAGADFEVSLEGSTLLMQGASGSSGFVTPLTAAATKSSVDLRAMDEAATSVRGLMEVQLAQAEPPLLDVLGHVVVPADATSTKNSFVASPDIGIAAAGDYARTVVLRQRDAGVPVTARLPRSRCRPIRAVGGLVYRAATWPGAVAEPHVMEAPSRF